jgi:4-hydroxy-tetrahydrodipicolinate reductase
VCAWRGQQDGRGLRLDEQLTIRHDSGSSAQPYVRGDLLAIRKVSSLTGLHRGLDIVLDLG